MMKKATFYTKNEFEQIESVAIENAPGEDYVTKDGKFFRHRIYKDKSREDVYIELRTSKIERSGYRYVYAPISYGKQRSAAKIVATAFIPNPNNYRYVNFKDNDGWNLNVSNLEWVSKRMTYEHSYNNILCVETGDIFMTQRDAAAYFGVSEGYMSDIFRTNNKLHKKYTLERISGEEADKLSKESGKHIISSYDIINGTVTPLSSLA